MSFTDVGKDAKRKGATHPKNVALPPDRPTPKATKKKKADKPYGFTYEHAIWNGDWDKRRRWFKTERQRDQAFKKERVSQAKWGPSNAFMRYRNLTKVQR